LQYLWHKPNQPFILACSISSSADSRPIDHARLGPGSNARPNGTDSSQRPASQIGPLTSAESSRSSGVAAAGVEESPSLLTDSPRFSPPRSRPSARAVDALRSYRLRWAIAADMGVKWPSGRKFGKRQRLRERDIQIRARLAEGCAIPRAVQVGRSSGWTSWSRAEMAVSKE